MKAPIVICATFCGVNVMTQQTVALPWLAVLQGEIFTDGNIRFQLMREDIPVSKRLRMGFMVNTDKEYMAGLSYIATKNLSVSTHYDSDMSFGAGLMFTY